MKKIIITLFLIPFCVFAKNEDIVSDSKSAIMLEASTGTVILEKDADKILPPASMTKIMTMLLTIEEIEKGNMKWDEIITIPVEASNMGGSQILLEAGEKMSVEDLFKGVAIASGNDAAVALAIRVSGSVSNFVDNMNKKAKQLGLKNTNFKNPHGLDDPNHYSTARDMSIIARELIKHEKVLEFTKIYDTYLRVGLPTKIWLVNTNKLVKFYDGVDGLKTGYTKEAGYCLTSTAKRGNMRLITVVMGSDSTSLRNKVTTNLLDYGFQQYKINTFVTSSDKVGQLDVINGEFETSNVVPAQDINFLNKVSEDVNKNLKYKLDLKKVKAPIKKGDVVGTLEVLENNKVIRKIDLTVDKDNFKVNLFELYIRNLIKLLQP